MAFVFVGLQRHGQSVINCVNRCQFWNEDFNFNVLSHYSNCQIILKKDVEYFRTLMATVKYYLNHFSMSRLHFSLVHNCLQVSRQVCGVKMKQMLWSNLLQLMFLFPKYFGGLCKNKLDITRNRKPLGTRHAAWRIHRIISVLRLILSVPSLTFTNSVVITVYLHLADMQWSFLSFLFFHIAAGAPWLENGGEHT